MQVKALRSFQGRHGFIRAGQTINLEDGYARDLAKNGLVELPGSEDKAPRPTNRQAVAAAPSVAMGGTSPVRQRPLGDGPTLMPLSSQAAQARAKTTPKKSAGGASKKTATKAAGTDPKKSDAS